MLSLIKKGNNLRKILNQSSTLSSSSSSSRLSPHIKLGYRCLTNAKSNISTPDVTNLQTSSSSNHVLSSSSTTKTNVAFQTKKGGWGKEKFNLIPFVKEEIRDVMKEVPDFKYYYIGDSQPEDYPYQNIPMDVPISLSDDIPEVMTSLSPDLKLSRLENGLRIASLDKGGYLSSLGLFVGVGSRDEDPSNFGVSHFIEHMSYSSTAHLSWLRTVKTMETLGVKAGCTAGREHIVYHAEVERKFVPIILPLMTGNVVFPRFIKREVHKREKEYEEDLSFKFDTNIDAQMTEYLHETAWQRNTLGNRVIAHRRDLHNYNPDCLREFMLKHYSPDRMVIVGVNVNHQELEKWTMRAFVDYETVPSTEYKQPKPVYTGGDYRVDMNSPNSHLAIGFETPGGWASDDVVPLTVLQTILGGGGSFSTGGPGKGMYTRLYLEVLSTNWVESCMAFNTQYADSGLFGLYITSQHSHAPRMSRLLGEQLKKIGEVTEDELKRAKNSLKSSIWMNLENRSVVMEDIGRQLLMSGKVMTGEELCNKVEGVTADDIRKAASRMMATKPTLVALGNINQLPRYEEVCAAFRT